MQELAPSFKMRFVWASGVKYWWISKGNGESCQINKKMDQSNCPLSFHLNFRHWRLVLLIWDGWFCKFSQFHDLSPARINTMHILVRVWLVTEILITSRVRVRNIFHHWKLGKLELGIFFITES
jgi:hypothetical protein